MLLGAVHGDNSSAGHGKLCFFSTHAKLPYSDLLGIWNEKIQQEHHCIFVTHWLLMQNAQAKERKLWWDSPTSQHDQAVGYFSEATKTCYFLMKLTSEPAGKKSGHVSSESVGADVNFKAEPSSLAHTSICSTVSMPDSHIWNKNILFYLISCALPYTRHGFATHILHVRCTVSHKLERMHLGQ